MAKIEFNKIILNHETKQEFEVEGNFEEFDTEIEVEFYHQAPSIEVFVDFIRKGKVFENITFINNDETHEISKSKVVSIVGDYFVTLE